jgi:molecular chaperone DnaJ
VVQQSRDYYEILGVPKNATEDEIKRSYRRLARQYHPDANGGDKEAEARFKEITVAYEVLKDPEKRRQYDMFGQSQGSSFNFEDSFFSADIGDLFESFFTSSFSGGFGRSKPKRRGSDLETVLTLDFKEAVFGAQKKVTVNALLGCSICQASGARPGTTPQRCTQCQGTGQVRRARQTLLGQVVRLEVCNLCAGTGEIITNPCSECRGQGVIKQEVTYSVSVPPGVDDGSVLRLSDKGSYGPRGAAPGDLYLHIKVKADPRYKRIDDNIIYELHISMVQAALGTKVEIDTLEEKKLIDILPGTQSGEKIVLRAQGVPHVRSRGRGDFIIAVVVDIPKHLSREEEKLLRDLARLRNEEVADSSKGLFSRKKNF